MNEEIKFRLRDIDGNILGYEKWDGLAGCWVYKSDAEWTKHGAGLKRHNVKAKDRYTCWRDDDQTDIYEGDWLKILRYDDFTPIAARVDWSHARFGFIATYWEADDRPANVVDGKEVIEVFNVNEMSFEDVVHETADVRIITYDEAVEIVEKQNMGSCPF